MGVSTEVHRNTVNLEASFRGLSCDVALTVWYDANLSGYVDSGDFVGFSGPWRAEGTYHAPALVLSPVR